MTVAPGEVVARRGPSGFRQDHAPVDHGIISRHRGRGQVAESAWTPQAGAAPRLARRRSVRLPAVQPLPRPDGAREHRYALNGRVQGSPRTTAPWAADRVGLADRSTSFRATSPGGRSSACPSPGRWPLAAGDPGRRAHGHLDTAAGTQSRAVRTWPIGVARAGHRHARPKVRAVADRVVGIRDGLLALRRSHNGEVTLTSPHRSAAPSRGAIQARGPAARAGAALRLRPRSARTRRAADGRS